MSRSSVAGFLGWRMVLLASMAQNCAMGLAFGSFGPLLASTEQQFGIKRAVAASGMSALMLALGLLSPLVGQALQRMTIRTVFMAGAALSAAGYLGLALAPSFAIALAMYVVVGAGVCLLGVIAPLTLITRWFVTARARALSIVNLPILLFATPFVIGELLPAHGRTAILIGIAAIFAVLIPLLSFVVDRPEQAGEKPWGASMVHGVAPAAEIGMPVPLRSILSNPSFWIVSLGVGAIAGSGSAYVVHIIPFGVEQQMTLQGAAVLLSLYSGCGILGTLLFGWLADRAGPVVALGTTAFFQSILWWGLVQVNGPSLFAVSALMGVCVVPINTLHGAAISTLFAGGSVARAMGYSYLVKLPFLFTFAPFVGLLFDRDGEYHLPFLLMAGLLGAVCAMFVLLVLQVQRRGRAAHATG
jgi:MFS family permease